MAVTYKLIDKVILSANQASVTFSSIPSTYTDLSISASIRTTQANVYGSMKLQLNGSSLSYTSREITGDGASATSTSRTIVDNGLFTGNADGASATTNTFSNANIYIPNYLSSNNKSLSIDTVMENNATEAYAYMITGLWSNTSAVTSVTFAWSASNLLSGSSFYLYGISKS